MTYTYVPALMSNGVVSGVPAEQIIAGLRIGVFFIVLLVIWSLVWKALALWKSARRGEKVWFIIFMIVNTTGILEIIYLIIKREPKSLTMPTSTTPPQA